MDRGVGMGEILGELRQVGDVESKANPESSGE